MDNPFALNVWLGAILYALVGLFGVVLFYGAGPGTKALTDGYGVTYSAIANSQTATGETLTR